MLTKKEQKYIARERILILLNKAKDTAKINISLAQRYVTLARRISIRLKVKIPDKYRRTFCKKCNSFFIPGKTLRKRLKNNKIIYACMQCNNIARYPYEKN